MDSLLIAFCLVLIVEGLGPLLLPNKWRGFIKEVSEQPAGVLRQMGGILVVAGGVGLLLLLE